jgi:hypothetical protein
MSQSLFSKNEGRVHEASLVVEALDSFRSTVARYVKSRPPKDGSELDEARAALEKLKSGFQSPSSEREICDNLLDHAASTAISDPTSIPNRLILQKYAAPAESYARRKEISDRLRSLPILENLELQGFTRVGDSRFFRKGHFVVSIEGAVPALYVPLNMYNASGRGEIEIVDIQGVAEQGRLEVVITLKDDEGHVEKRFRRTGSASTLSFKGMPTSVTRTPHQVPPNSPEDQLARAGFSGDSTCPNVYRLSVEAWGRGECSELIALVQDGRIASIVKSASPCVQEKIDENTRVAGDGEVPHDSEYGDETAPTLILTNTRIEFKVDVHGGIVEGSQYLFKELSPDELGIQACPVVKETSGFAIGGQNSTETIKGLQTINGLSISDLEGSMRPSQVSSGGFLDRSQSLVDVLAADNEYVLAQGLSHQELAKHLKYAMAIRNRGFGHEFEYNGSTFKIAAVTWRGWQDSPFRDGTTASTDYLLTNMKTGRGIAFSGLVPEMIERYGFYEGNCRYRVDPAEVLKVFELETYPHSRSDTSASPNRTLEK